MTKRSDAHAQRLRPDKRWQRGATATSAKAFSPSGCPCKCLFTCNRIGNACFIYPDRYHAVLSCLELPRSALL
eukprot:15449776-Alexandrium_andersonii.AAC.1